MEPIQPYAFNRGKPFYPVMMAYILQLHSLSEIVVHGIPGIVRAFQVPDEMGDPQIIEAISKFMGPLHLEVTGDSKPLDIHIEKTAAELFKNHSFLVNFQVTAASYCLVMGYEIVKDKPYRNTDPIWEFLRHCRNAVAHGGKFNFIGNEPKMPAEWRGIAIERSMHGEPLIKNETGKGYLGLGDPVALLWDIESKYPQMTI